MVDQISPAVRRTKELHLMSNLWKEINLEKPFRPKHKILRKGNWKCCCHLRTTWMEPNINTLLKENLFQKYVCRKCVFRRDNELKYRAHLNSLIKGLRFGMAESKPRLKSNKKSVS